jgi:hypothetical protein
MKTDQLWRQKIWKKAKKPRPSRLAPAGVSQIQSGLMAFGPYFWPKSEVAFCFTHNAP